MLPAALASQPRNARDGSREPRSRPVHVSRCPPDTRRGAPILLSCRRLAPARGRDGGGAAPMIPRKARRRALLLGAAAGAVPLGAAPGGGARAAPDGHTLTNGTSGTFGVNPGVLPRLPYDPERDFAAITNLTVGSLIVICHPSFPARTVGDLAEAARARPGAIDVATAGPATAKHMSVELLQLRTGLRFNVVHYRGSGPAVTDLVAGNVPVMCDSIPSALPHLRSGRARALALTGARRVPQLPEVPTLAETLSPGYEAVGWIGLAAPAATPPAIVRKVNADVVAILREPAVATRLSEMG